MHKLRIETILRAIITPIAYVFARILWLVLNDEQQKHALQRLRRRVRELEAQEEQRKNGPLRIK